MVAVVVIVVAAGLEHRHHDDDYHHEQPALKPSRRSPGCRNDGDTLGSRDGAVTPDGIEDPQCPFCRQWNIDTLPTVVENYVRAGGSRSCTAASS